MSINCATITPLFPPPVATDVYTISIGTPVAVENQEEYHTWLPGHFSARLDGFDVYVAFQTGEFEAIAEHWRREATTKKILVVRQEGNLAPLMPTDVPLPSYKGTLPCAT